MLYYYKSQKCPKGFPSIKLHENLIASGFLLSNRSTESGFHDTYTYVVKDGSITVCDYTIDVFFQGIHIGSFGRTFFNLQKPIDIRDLAVKFTQSTSAKNSHSRLQVARILESQAQ
jgi:hypothetical protein